MIRSRLSDSSGFTLMELVVGMALGMIILIAAFQIVDRAFVVNKQVSDREDALQRGRSTLELMDRQLRSQICLGTARTSLVDAEANQVSFYVYLGDPTSSNTNPELHTLQLTGSTIKELDFVGTGTYPNLTFDQAHPTRSRILVTNVQGGSPLFTYYAFDSSVTAGNGALTRLDPGTGSLSTTDSARVVDIKVNFTALPTNVSKLDQATNFQNDVYMRSADPLSPTGGPRCS
ncbi:MAG TPA: prepilin-type N-terminal cleavage/methylation domain-containing protein [Thermoleophilaceae bacterium]|jgi:Tfp pilus assembly protein FimT